MLGTLRSGASNQSPQRSFTTFANKKHVQNGANFPIEGVKIIEKTKARLSSPQRYTFSRTTCLSKNLFKPPTPPKNCTCFFFVQQHKSRSQEVKSSQVFGPTTSNHRGAERIRKSVAEFASGCVSWLFFPSSRAEPRNQGPTHPTNVWDFAVEKRRSLLQK